MEIRIRPITSADAGPIAELWLRCTAEVAELEPIYRPALEHAELSALLAGEMLSGARRGWGAFAGRQLVAYLTCRIEEEAAIFTPRRYLYIIDVDVAPSHRRQGLSRLLLAEAETFARTAGITRLELAFAAADPRARATWESQGFRAHFIHMHRKLA